jgi:hypothetical protein
VYGQILPCAGLGIAFDISRSRFDAATELTEMVACEIPVLAFKFGCVSEFIPHEKTRLLLGNFRERLALLKRVLDPQSDALTELTKNCARKPPDWDSQWETAFADLFGRAYGDWPVRKFPGSHLPLWPGTRWNSFEWRLELLGDISREAVLSGSVGKVDGDFERPVRKSCENSSSYCPCTLGKHFVGEDLPTGKVKRGMSASWQLS